MKQSIVSEPWNNIGYMCDVPEGMSRQPWKKHTKSANSSMEARYGSERET